jgi:uncharacterized damage-inducible protein DinB
MQEEFLKISAGCLDEFRLRIEACVDLLSEEQLWWRPNPAVNSVANLLLHLSGNLSQWVLAGLGGVTYDRHRTEEFTADRSATRAELVRALATVVADCGAVIRRLSSEELLRERHIQKSDVNGVYVVVHVVEHMSYHTGQIVQLTKEVLGPEGGIDFYPQHKGE